MFWKKKKKEALKEENERIVALKNQGNKILEEISSVLADASLNSEIYDSLQQDALLWQKNCKNIDDEGLLSIYTMVDESLYDLKTAYELLDKKERFLKSLNNFEIEITGETKKLQKIAQSIPKVVSPVILNRFKEELEELTQFTENLNNDLDENLKIHLQEADLLKFERMLSQKQSFLEKIDKIMQVYTKKQKELEKVQRSSHIEEERNQLFSFIDNFQNRAEKFERQIREIREEILDTETISDLDIMKAKFEKLNINMDKLKPPVFNTPEIQGELSTISEKIDSKIMKLEESFVDAKNLLSEQMFLILGEIRSQRLERSILRSKRLPIRSLTEILRSKETILIDWLEQQNEEEPLRLQTPTLVAMAVNRLSNQSLHDYLLIKMQEFSRFESEHYPEKHSQILDKFREADRFQN